MIFEMLNVLLIQTVAIILLLFLPNLVRESLQGGYDNLGAASANLEFCLLWAAKECKRIMG